MILFMNPKILVCNDELMEIKVPLNWRTKNHLNSMYFGALCAAADVAGGFSAMKVIEESKKNVHLSFKSFSAEFLLRAEADTHFYFYDVKKLNEFVQDVIANPNERKEMMLNISAKCPSINEKEVAKFKLLLSLKYKV